MKKDPLYEVIFDIASNLSAHLYQLGDGERDALMDAVDGSRGLCFNHAIPWAKEFQEKWAARSDDEIDYLIEIDRFVSNKVAALREVARCVVSIQVVPTVQRSDEVGAQFDGPDEHTTHWSVYERNADGTVRWVADFGRNDEALAMLFAQGHAERLGVSIEAQPWKVQKQAEIIMKEVAPAERFHVACRIAVDAPTPRDAALKARELLLQPTNAAVFDVHDELRGPIHRIDLSETSDGN
jgi:hypothetical protein